MCLCHQAVYFGGTGQWPVMLCGREDIRRSDWETSTHIVRSEIALSAEATCHFHAAHQQVWTLATFTQSLNQRSGSERLWVIRKKWPGNIRYRPEAETVACDSCFDVVEMVITNSSPATAVVDFQTSFTSIAAAHQPRRHWRTCVLLVLMNILLLLLLLLLFNTHSMLQLQLS